MMKNRKHGILDTIGKVMISLIIYAVLLVYLVEFAT